MYTIRNLPHFSSKRFKFFNTAIHPFPHPFYTFYMFYTAKKRDCLS